ncbi:hypothetical protein Tco_0169457 [Tanacetum coccineum]
MALPPRDQRHQYLRFEGLQYVDADIADFETRLGKIYSREVHRVLVFDFESLIAEMAEGLTCRMLMDHRDAQGQSSGRGIFGYTPFLYSYQGSDAEGMDVGSVNIPYLLARYLRRFALGRKQGAMIFGGQFIARLAEHFGLLTKERLQGLTVIDRDLLVIDIDELARLHICEELVETWAWVASGLKRQPDAAVGAPVDAGGAPDIDEGTQAVPVPAQRRRVRQRIGDASTSAAPLDEDQLDP